MPEARTCPECHTLVPDDAPQDLCPKCLLGQALSGSNGNGVHEHSPDSSHHPGRFIAPAPAQLAVQFPQLEILDLLGQGGMGAVYRAAQRKLDRLVALKIMPPEAATDSAFAERFGREARALARLNHPNIVAVHDYGEAGGLYYFIMEYVDGLNLRQLMHGDAIEPDIALQIVPQICDALQYAHEEAIIHRDIKPENILLDKRGRVKIADFGLAKLVGHAPAFTLTGSQQIMGTPHYMAPEQMEKPSSVDHRADIYSVGVVFYEMLTGGLPLGRFALPSHKSGVDQRLDEIVLHALEKEPGSRYQSISEVKTDIEWVAGKSGPSQVGDHRDPQVAERDLVAIGRSVTNPSQGLVFTGFVALLSWIVIGVIAFQEYASTVEFKSPHGVLVCMIATAAGLAVVIASCILIVGGVRMMRLKSYGFAITTACVAALPWSLAFPLGLVFGIWATAVLQMPDVKAAFTVRRRTGGTTGSGTGATDSGTGAVVGFVRSLREFVFDTINRRQSTVAADSQSAEQMKAFGELASARSPLQRPREWAPGPLGRPNLPHHPEPPTRSQLGPDLLSGAAMFGLLIVVGLVTLYFGIPSFLAALPVIPFAGYYIWAALEGSYRARVLAGLAGVIGSVAIVLAAHHNVASDQSLFAWLLTQPNGLSWVVLGLDIWFFTWLLAQKNPPAKAARGDEPEENSTLIGLSAQSREIRRRLQTFQEAWTCYVFPEFDSAQLSLCRKACHVPPDERILGLFDLTGNEDADNVLLLGEKGMYFVNYKQSPQAGVGTVPYTEFPKRAFVNHGSDVYLGNDQFLCTDPDAEVDCEAVANLLNGVREIIVNSES